MAKKSVFTKAIKLRKKKYDYIKDFQKKKGYKTQAGTLDFIINYFEKHYGNETVREVPGE